ncbi:MAG: helix-turn-helix domain-containing protein [Thermoanaerobacteraceae bacterium]|nr:helix-turn-helix domain-containing protein [Thermoanaerobacteraceae bacterium]
MSPDLPESVVVPVACQEKIEGYLVILQSSRYLNDIEIRGIETGATIVALEFAKEKAIAETEIRLRGELLDELLRGGIDNTEVTMKRAAHLGINLAGRLAVIVVGFQWQSKIAPYEVELHSEIIHLLRSRFSQHPGGILVAVRDNRVVGILRFYSETEKELPGRLVEILKAAKVRFPKVRLGIGVGRPYEGLEYVKTSYEEAQVALKVALDRGEGKPVFFSELGPLRVLFYVKDAPAAYSFCQEYIGKLQAYDAQNKTDLMATLASYLENDGNLRRTAEALFVHKNSVIYRVKKIEEITGLDLNDAENRFALMLALKLAQLTP